MAPHHTALHEDPRVLLPGLEYARSLIETAILICEHVDRPPADAKVSDSESRDRRDN